MISLAKDTLQGAELLCVLVQMFMQYVLTQTVSQLLGALHVVNAQEIVVSLYKVDSLALEELRQCTVTVAVKLETKRCSGRHAQIAQTQILVHEVVVVVQAFASIALR